MRLADPLAAAAKLAGQLINQNRRILELARIEVNTQFNGREVLLRLMTGNTVGAIPLVSPVTGKADYGVIIKPRFPWDGIGAMLGQMGWRVVPTPLKLDTFKGSERGIPTWVLSSMILIRISNLLKSIGPKFELINENLTAPRGHIRWAEYSSRFMPTGQFLSVPCTFPELQQNRHLLGSIRYCLERVIED